MTTSEAEHSAMRRALALAVTPGVPLGPNPRVGCVLLAPDGTTVAEGFHRGAGTAHADRGHGRCCARHGRTPVRECAALWQSSDHKSLRALGAVEIRTGGHSPRPDHTQWPVDQVELLDRRS